MRERLTAAASTGRSEACWGQATQVFARMGVMGEHASQFPTPRLGLRNLARAVAAELELEIAACR